MSTNDIRIGDGDRAAIVDRAARCPHDPYTSFDAFLDDAADAFDALDADATDVVRSFAAGGRDCSALVIGGLPIDPTLPPTPLMDDGDRYTTSTVTEYTMCVIASAAGEPVGYAPERWGQLVHNVFPTQGEKIPSQRFRTGLGFHTELSCHPEAPDHVLLLCLRQDPAQVATTWVLDVRKLVEHLPDAVTAALFAAEFALDLGHLHYVYRSNGVRIDNRPEHRPLIGILSGDRDDPAIRYEPALMTPMTERARWAFDQLAESVADLATPVRLSPGTALLIDNRRSLHARSTFPAVFDGTDRWLRRMMVSGRPRPRKAGRAERVIDTDLVVGWADRPTVASMAGAL